MAQLAEVKHHAARLFGKREPMHALRLYDAIVAGAPRDFEARIGVADCLAALGELQRAAPVYRAAGWYAIKSGHPLAAVVVARTLESMQQEAADLLAGLVAHYGSESEMLGKLASRLALPDPSTDLPAPDLRAEAPDNLIELASQRATHCMDDFDGYPDALHAIPLLSELSEQAFREVVGTMVVRRLPDKNLVIRQGEPGESFFFVAAGRVDVYATDSLGRPIALAKLAENSVFGEMALISAQPRSASVAVDGGADLLEVTRESLAALADELQPVADALHRFTRDRLLRNLMATNPLFRPFTKVQRMDLLRRFTSHDVAPGTPIINEGDHGRGLFVVLAGEVEVAKAGTPLATLRAGELFGEMALVRTEATTATVTASRPATVLFLAREYVDRLVQGVPDIAKYLAQLAEERELDTQLMLSDDLIVEDDERVLV